MPVKCKKGKPRYRYKGKVRLAFCGNKVVEAKKKSDIVKKKAKLTIKGKPKYIKYLSEHLKKEHPSTKKRLTTTLKKKRKKKR